MRLFLFCLIPFLLSATINEPLRCAPFSGYRNDRLHWHLQQPADDGALTYSELYRDLQFWENGLAFKVIHRDIAFFARGGYAAFGTGSLFQRYSDLNFTSDQPHFRFDPSSWAADGGGYIGYAVNLTADRTYKVILIPLLGFSAHFERITRKNPRPDPLASDNAEGAASYTMRSTLPRQLHQTWYGIFIGGQFQIEPGGRFITQAGYSYHWNRCIFKTHMEEEVSLFNNAAALISQQTTQTRLKVSEGGNLGHTAWASMDYILSNFWRVGLGGQIHYFVTGNVNARLREQINGATQDLSEKFKLRWTSISGWVQVSREL